MSQANVALMVLQERLPFRMTSCASRWWTPNATRWIPATPPSMSPRPSTCQRTPTVTAAAAAPCQRACADGRPAPDASTMGPGTVSPACCLSWWSSNAPHPPPPSGAVMWAFPRLHLCLCAAQPTVQTAASANAWLGRTLPTGGWRRSFTSSKTLTLRPWDPTLTRSGNMWECFIAVINFFYDLTKYMTVLELGRKIGYFSNLKVFSKPALFIHIYPSPSSLQSRI